MDSGVVVTLFRHGITEKNLEKKYLGWSDPGITDKAQARLATLQPGMTEYGLCVLSDLTRCKQSAEILCPNTPRITTEAFREMYFGEWELKTYAELCNQAVYREWLDDPFTKRPPNGESFSDMGKRVTAGWEMLRKLAAEQNNQRILLVTHGGVIRMLLTMFANEERSFWQWKIPHGTGIKLSWNYQDWKEGRRCTLLQVVPTTANENG